LPVMTCWTRACIEGSAFCGGLQIPRFARDDKAWVWLMSKSPIGIGRIDFLKRVEASSKRIENL
jgi:hypothetical protein